MLNVVYYQTCLMMRKSNKRSSLNLKKQNISMQFK